jgi:hypothetical protein
VGQKTTTTRCANKRQLGVPILQFIAGVNTRAKQPTTPQQITMLVNLAPPRHARRVRWRRLRARPRNRDQIGHRRIQDRPGAAVADHRQAGPRVDQCMPDTLSLTARSERMSRIRGKETGPERIAHRIVLWPWLPARKVDRDRENVPIIVCSDQMCVAKIGLIFVTR